MWYKFHLHEKKMVKASILCKFEKSLQEFFFLPVHYHVFLNQSQTTKLNSCGITQMKVLPTVCCKNSTDWAIFSCHGIHRNVLNPFTTKYLNAYVVPSAKYFNK